MADSTVKAGGAIAVESLVAVGFATAVEMDRGTGVLRAWSHTSGEGQPDAHSRSIGLGAQAKPDWLASRWRDRPGAKGPGGTWGGRAARGRSTALEAIDRTRLRHDVDPPTGVLAEGNRAGDAEPLRAIPACGATCICRQLQRADLPHAEVGVDVAAIEIAQARVAHHVAPGNRAAVGRAVFRVRMGIVEDRVGEAA